MSKRGAIVRLDESAFPYVLVNAGTPAEQGGDHGVIRPEEGENSTERLSPADAVCGFLKDRKVNWVTLELPMTRAVVYILDLPPMKTADARKALPFEFERKLPVPLENFFWSYSFLQSGRDGYRVFAAGVTKSFLTPFLEAFREAGIVIRGVELAAFRFHARQVTGRDLVSVGLGEDTVDLAVLKEGKPVDLKALELPPDPEVAPRILSRTLEREVELCQCTEVWLYGKDRPDLRTALESLTGIQLKVGERVSREGAKTQKGLFFLDVLPDTYRVRRNPHNIILGVLMVLLVVAFYFQLTVKARIDEKALADVTRELSALRESVDSVSGPLKERESVFRSLRVLRPFFSDRNRPFVALRELSRLLPKDTWLVNFDMDEKGKIEIDGYSSRSSELLALLEESPRFTGVEMAGPVIVQPMGEHFSIRMYWEQVSHEGQ